MSSLEDRLKLLEPAPASNALRTRIAHPERTRSRGFRYIPLAAAAASLIAVFIFALTEAPHGRTSSTTQAEREFRKIEETVMSAKTLRLEVQRHVLLLSNQLWKEETVKTDLTILLKEGNRARIDIVEERNSGTPKAIKAHFRYLSDGKHLRSFAVIGDQLKPLGPETATPADLHQRFLFALARLEVGVPNNILLQDLATLQKQAEVTDLRRGEDEKMLLHLDYRIDGADAWMAYSPDSHLPYTRNVERKDVSIIVEAYSPQKDVPIDDAEFFLPDPK